MVELKEQQEKGIKAVLNRNDVSDRTHLSVCIAVLLIMITRVMHMSEQFIGITTPQAIMGITLILIVLAWTIPSLILSKRISNKTKNTPLDNVVTYAGLAVMLLLMLIYDMIPITIKNYNDLAIVYIISGILIMLAMVQIQLSSNNILEKDLKIKNEYKYIGVFEVLSTFLIEEIVETENFTPGSISILCTIVAILTISISTMIINKLGDKINNTSITVGYMMLIPIATLIIPSIIMRAMSTYYNITIICLISCLLLEIHYLAIKFVQKIR